MSGEQPGPSSQSMDCIPRDNARDTAHGNAHGNASDTSRDTSRDVMECEESVVCKNSVSSGSVVFLHPLVTMNIADHTTRCKISGKEFKHALGVLLGKQSGRDIEIISSFDVCYDVIDGAWVLNRDYLDNKLEQLSQIAPGQTSFCDKPNTATACDIVGWYALGTLPTQAHLDMHSQISQLNESPVLLMFDHDNEKELAMKTFESIIDVSNNQSRTVFVELQYTVKTTESERIGIDHAAGASVAGFSAVSDIVGSSQSAISMLNGRVKLICDYITEVKNGTRQATPAVMRSIASLVSSLPLAKEHSDSFSQENSQELVDGLMIATLATLTNGILHHDEMVAKSNVIYTSSVNSKKIRGLDIMTPFTSGAPPAAFKNMDYKHVT